MKIILIFLTVTFSLLWARAEENLCKKSTEGTDFWFGFMESRNYHSAHFLEITVTARESTNFRVTIGNEETPFGETYSVNANGSYQLKIPWELVEATGSEEIQNKGIHLVSEKPVNVYGLNWDNNSADVAVIYPVESLGNEYFAMCYNVHIHERNDGSYGNGRNSEFMVVAAEDSTEVVIIPSVQTEKLVNPGDTIFITLNKGEVYQVQSKNKENTPAQGDLTSSYILSNKPVAFYSGSLGTTIPAENGTSAWDHLYEQIPPIHAWGREYYTVPLRSREQDRYRIMAAENNTVVKITGMADIKLNRGEFKEIILFYNQPARIIAEKPILVAQYSQSKSVDNNFTGGNGDPFMIILSSTSQVKNDVTFVAYNSNQIKKYFVNIITLTSEIENIRFNDQIIASEFKKFPEGDYSYVQKSILAGNYRIHNTNPDRGFLAYVYGYGGVESYGYGVGFNLNLVLDLGESINFNGDTLLLCQGNEITLDAGPYFDHYLWNTGDTLQTLKVKTGGKYQVQTSTIDGCKLEDSIFVFVSNPEIQLETNYGEGCSPYSIKLSAKDGFKKYVWQNELHDTISTEKVIELNSTGEYYLTVFNEYNCPARDTMELIVFPVPNIKIEGEKLICGKKTSHLKVSLTNAPEETWNYAGSVVWSSNDSAAVVLKNPSQTSIEINVANWGEYEFYYQLKTIDGCIRKDTFTVEFQPTPTSTFQYVENPEDKCEGYSREVKYTGNASPNANLLWDFGGAKLIDSLNWDNFTVSVGAFNTNPYLTLIVEENGCWSDTTSSLLGANPKFKLETNKARGCDSLSVLFTGILEVEDELLFEWDFGDGSPISNEREINHFYSDIGFYNVGLTITNKLSGCKIGFQIDSMIKVFPTPTAHITADIERCYPDSAKLIYSHFIDSSICFWEFENAHLIDQSRERIWMYLDEPFSRAILTVDEFGCKSKPAEIQLKRKPQFNLLVDKNEGCQPYELEIFTESNDKQLDYYWLQDSSYNNLGQSAKYTLRDSGFNAIEVIANSAETGCIDTLIKKDWIYVHPKPNAMFEVDYQKALLEQATITYTNLSGNATFFNWDFGDNNYSSKQNPQHTYTELGEFKTTLIAESDFGCLDTSMLEIQILPFSSYTPNAFRPDSEIMENQTFMPVVIGADPNRFNIKILDRWGQIIFQSNSPDIPWDGTSGNGNPAPSGNYVWVSKYFDIQGFEHQQSGQVLLIR